MNEDTVQLYNHSKEEQRRLNNKHGLRTVGEYRESDHEDDNKSPEQRNQERAERRNENLKKARKARKKNIKKRKRKETIDNIKEKLPSKKNKEVNEDTEGFNYLWGDDNESFFDQSYNLELDEGAIPNSVTNEAFNMHYKFKCLDDTIFMDHINESASDKLVPVYVILTYSGSTVSKLVKVTTGDEYTHASISFDTSLTRMYTFGRNDDKSVFHGHFKFEDITSDYYQKRETPVPYAVYCIACTERQVAQMQKRLNYFEKNKSKFDFDFPGLIRNAIGIDYEPENKWFCSRFVSDILNAGSPDQLYVDKPALQKPQDFANAEYTYLIDRGPDITKYDKTKADRKTIAYLRSEQIRRKNMNEQAIYDIDYLNPFLEATLNYQLTVMDEAGVDNLLNYMKSFKVNFDQEGNIIIRRREYDQLDRKFRKSLNDIKAFRKANDIASMKNELCRIYYMATLINDIKNKRDKSKPLTETDKALLDLYSVMMNAFKDNLAFVIKADPEFDFKSYYNTTKYGNDTMIPKKIYGTVAKTLITLI